MIDDYMDLAWEQIENGVYFAATVVDRLLQPLQPLGPVAIVALLALAAVAIAKISGQIFQTRRYMELKDEFQHWYTLRQQALTCKDAEKGKLLAKNIDQARLNRVYYDYFFEGFLKSLVTRFLPLLTIMAYVNSAFRPESLMTHFGQDHLFQWQWLVAEPIKINAPFWFVLAVIGIYLLWWVAVKLIRLTKPVLTAHA